MNSDPFGGRCLSRTLLSIAFPWGDTASITIWSSIGGWWVVTWPVTCLQASPTWRSARWPGSPWRPGSCDMTRYVVTGFWFGITSYADFTSFFWGRVITYPQPNGNASSTTCWTRLPVLPCRPCPVNRTKSVVARSGIGTISSAKFPTMNWRRVIAYPCPRCNSATTALWTVIPLTPHRPLSIDWTVSQKAFMTAAMPI